MKPGQVEDAFPSFTYHDVKAFSKKISIWLRHGDKRYPATLNRLLWAYVRVMCQEFDINTRQLCAIIAHDKKKRFELVCDEVQCELVGTCVYTSGFRAFYSLAGVPYDHA